MTKIKCEHTRVAPGCVPVCPGCEQEIDPDHCGCGTSRSEHGDPMSEGHSFLPMGCDCLRGSR